MTNEYVIGLIGVHEKSTAKQGCQINVMIWRNYQPTQIWVGGKSRAHVSPFKNPFSKINEDLSVIKSNQVMPGILDNNQANVARGSVAAHFLTRTPRLANIFTGKPSLMFSNLYLETLFLKRHGLMFDAHQEQSVVNSEVSFDLGLIRFLVLESVAALPDRQTRRYITRLCPFCPTYLIY